jgi:hypothetical protein
VSHRDIEVLAERGIEVDHIAVTGGRAADTWAHAVNEGENRMQEVDEPLVAGVRRDLGTTVLRTGSSGPLNEPAVEARSKAAPIAQ